MKCRFVVKGGGDVESGDVVYPDDIVLIMDKADAFVLCKSIITQLGNGGENLAYIASGKIEVDVDGKGAA